MLEYLQKQKCALFHAPFFGIDLNCKVGVSRGFLQSSMVLNGLRHPPELGTTGWFLWGDEEISKDSDFFLTLHAEHLAQYKPAVLPFLGFAPGWLFHVEKNLEDAWFQNSLLEVD